MQTSVKLSKSTYSEQVVRKSLYWLTECCGWTLEEDEESWVLIFRNDEATAENCKEEFHRLLNDFILREKLDKATRRTRVKIVTAALEKLGHDASRP